MYSTIFGGVFHSLYELSYFESNIIFGYYTVNLSYGNIYYVDESQLFGLLFFTKKPQSSESHLCKE